MKASHNVPSAGRAATNKLACFADEIREVIKTCPDGFTAKQWGEATGFHPRSVSGFVAVDIVQIVRKGDRSGSHKYPSSYRLAPWVPGWLEARAGRGAA